MTMNYETLRDFVKKVIEVKGGIAEEEEKGMLEILLPERIRKRLSAGEYKRLSFLPHRQGTEFVTYGSPFLDKVVSLTRDFGETARVLIEDVPLKKGKLASLIETNFDFPNSKKLGSLLDERLICSYLLINFRASIISDERKEEIITTMVDEQTLRAPLELIDPILRLGSYQEKEPGIVMKAYPLEKVYERTKKLAIKILNQNLKDLEMSNLRRLKRDIERLGSYYEDLKKEMRKRMMKKLSSEDSPSLEEKFSSKIELINIEFERKKQDLLDKYALRIKLEPINACRIYLPKMVTQYEVQRRTFKKRINFFWNPLIREIEPLVCQACLEDTQVIYLCDELHLTCSRCYFRCPECGKKICKKCFPQNCPTCGRPH